MSAEALRSLLQDTKYPIALCTRSGDRHVVPDRRHLDFPSTFPDLVVICPRRRGIIMLDLDQLDAVEAAVAEAPQESHP
jgi:hypothetical protein